MKKVALVFIIGFILFLLGIYISTLLSSHWVIIGTLLGVGGGLIMGGSSYYLPKR